jgi:hypothetical protein
VFAVDVTTWPRCDAECSPERGCYYHPPRHSAGQPIMAGWADQWIAQVSFDRDSWTAPVDAARLHPLDDTDQQAAPQDDPRAAAPGLPRAIRRSRSPPRSPRQTNQGPEGGLTDHSQHHQAAGEVSGQPSMPAGLNHKLR